MRWEWWWVGNWEIGEYPRVRLSRYKLKNEGNPEKCMQIVRLFKFCLWEKSFIVSDCQDVYHSLWTNLSVSEVDKMFTVVCKHEYFGIKTDIALKPSLPSVLTTVPNPRICQHCRWRQHTYFYFVQRQTSFRQCNVRNVWIQCQDTQYILQMSALKNSWGPAIDFEGMIIAKASVILHS